VSKAADIAAINRWDRLVLTDSGDVCAIDVFLDADGDEVGDPALAVVAIGQLPDKRWFSVDMRAYETARTH
jgi:hypothetical protein